MDNLENNLLNLPKPKPKLRLKADLKIRWKIRMFIFAKKFGNLASLFLIKNSLLRKTAIASLIIFVILGGTSVYAAANDNITLGDALYPLKKTVESVQQNFSLTKSSKVDTLSNFSEKRLKEALNLAEENNHDPKVDDQILASDNIKETINEAVSNIDSAVKASQEIDNAKSAQRAKDLIKRKNEAIIEYLDNIGNIVENDSNKEVFDKVNEAKDAINKYNKILDKGHEDGEEMVRPANKDTDDGHKQDSDKGKDTQIYKPEQDINVSEDSSNSGLLNNFQEPEDNSDENRGDD